MEVANKIQTVFQKKTAKTYRIYTMPCSAFSRRDGSHGIIRGRRGVERAGLISLHIFHSIQALIPLCSNTVNKHK